MKKRNIYLGVFLLSLMFGASPVLACSTFNVEVVNIELCGSLASGNFSYEFDVSGIRVASGAMTPFYINENGHQENDNSFLITAFWIPSTPTLARFKIRVLKQFREDSSGFFGPAGTVIYAQAI